MKSNQIEILAYLDSYIQLLENTRMKLNEIPQKGSAKNIINLKEEEKILIFSEVKQTIINGKPYKVELSKDEATFKDFQEIVDKFVERLGPDINNQGYLKRIEFKNKKEWYMRYWSFNEFHEKITGYPDEKGYSLIFHFSKFQSSLLIWNLPAISSS